MFVLAVILSAAKDPDNLNVTKTFKPFQPQNRVPHPSQSHREGCDEQASTSRALLIPLATLTLTITLLLTPLTTFIWSHAPELTFLQFPWRLLAILAAVLALTIALGVLFTAIQAYEYRHILTEHLFYSPESASAGLYGSSFFMATGFHGFHVIIGTIFLSVCLFRLINGGFSPQKHFGFEAAAWYWHFVDVVWLFLFTFLYVTFGSGWGH